MARRGRLERMPMTPSIRPFGDCGLNVELGSGIDETTSLRVTSLMRRVEQLGLPGIVDMVPTFRSLFVCYDPLAVDVGALVEGLEEACRTTSPIERGRQRVLDVPVLYGEEHAAELGQVARFAGLDERGVIDAHTAQDYLVHMNGSAGGAAFIQMPAALAAVPRKRTPAIDVPAGTVLLAGGVGTAFKALAGPTGWYAIGKSPLRQWIPTADPPLLILAGDYIRYRPVDAAEYAECHARVDAGEYDPVWLPRSPN
jgi:inhibitor of KinA